MTHTSENDLIDGSVIRKLTNQLDQMYQLLECLTPGNDELYLFVSVIELYSRWKVDSDAKQILSRWSLVEDVTPYSDEAYTGVTDGS